MNNNSITLSYDYLNNCSATRQNQLFQTTSQPNTQPTIKVRGTNDQPFEKVPGYAGGTNGSYRKVPG